MWDLFRAYDSLCETNRPVSEQASPCVGTTAPYTITYGFRLNNNITRGHTNKRVQNSGRVIHIKQPIKKEKNKSFSGNVCPWKGRTGAGRCRPTSWHDTPWAASIVEWRRSRRVGIYIFSCLRPDETRRGYLHKCSCQEYDAEESDLQIDNNIINN
jgi:hypothetical protein